MHPAPARGSARRTPEGRAESATSELRPRAVEIDVERRVATLRVGGAVSPLTPAETIQVAVRIRAAAAHATVARGVTIVAGPGATHAIVVGEARGRVAVGVGPYAALLGRDDALELADELERAADVLSRVVPGGDA